jgi:hypothetical protein
MKRTLINVAAFQMCWFAAVLGAAAGIPLLGPAFAALWLPLHIVATKSSALVELKLIVAAGVLGYALDSALVLGGCLSFPPQAEFGTPSTLWMVSLWLGFAATLRHALGWLRGRYAVAALLGALFGPLAYWGGSKLGAIVLSEPGVSLTAVSAEWLIAMPLLLLALAYFERSQTAGIAVNAAASIRQER